MTYSHYHKLTSQGVQFRRRDSLDFYPTNDEHVQELLSHVQHPSPEMILDVGIGNGIFGYYARRYFPDTFIAGVEINNNLPVTCDYDIVTRCDFLQLTPEPVFDCIIGNPPFYCAEAIVRKAWHFLKPEVRSEIIFLLPLNFLASMGRYKLFHHDFPLHQLIVCSDRPSFTGDGKTDSREYAFFHWKRSEPDSRIRWSLSYPAHKDKYGYAQKQFNI